MCVANASEDVTEFTFNLKTGIDAEDETDIKLLNDIDPAKAEGQKLEEVVSKIIKIVQMTPGPKSEAFPDPPSRTKFDSNGVVKIKYKVIFKKINTTIIISWFFTIYFFLNSGQCNFPVLISPNFNKNKL